MGMRIGGPVASGGTQSVGVANWQQQQQSIKDMMAALQAGDLGSAQKAYAKLPGAAQAASGSSPLAQIGKALQSGDLAAAQKAAQAMQTARGAHRHHPSEQATAPSAAAPAPGPAGTGTVVNLTA